MSCWFFSPTLYWTPSLDSEVGAPYVANGAEVLGQALLDLASFSARVAFHAFPFALIAAVAATGHGGHPAEALMAYQDRVIMAFTPLLSLATFGALLRGAGRAINHRYAAFLALYKTALSDWNRDSKRELSAYDFSFSAWPAEFSAIEEND